MNTRDIFNFLDRIAPPEYQENYDNSGIQVGHIDPLTGIEANNRECTGVLVCLDVTEEIIHEACEKNCNLVVSHHPLVFNPVRRVNGETMPERCIAMALVNDIAIYSAHTSLDNAKDGVNYKIAEKLGLVNVEWLEKGCDENCGSGIIGEIPGFMPVEEFLLRLKKAFNAECIMHTEPRKQNIRKVAVCGGAGAFLSEKARERSADCFITGEISYHHYFDSGDMMLIAMGHYQSERFTIELIADRLSDEFHDLKVLRSGINTNPIKYLL